LILGKIIKIVATRCHILKLICTKFDFGGGSAPDTAGKAYSAPHTSCLHIRGPTSKGREGKKAGREGQGREEGSYFFTFVIRNDLHINLLFSGTY